MKICALRMLQHNLVFLGVLGVLTACAVEPVNSSVSPRVTASPEVSETKADWRIYQTRLAPDQRHLAIWRYQASDSLAPFFDISQSEVLVMDLTTQQVIYQVPWTALTHSGLYAGAADQLWWQDSQTLLLTGETDGERFIEQIQLSARSHQRLYTFPGSISAFLSRQDSLYLLSENRLERLALQTLQQETLAEFSGQADLLYPTAHQDLWILGARGDFSLMLEPLPAPDYYLLDLTRPQTPDLRPCALEQTADQETIASKQQRFVLGAEAKQLQPTVLFCP